MYTNALAALRMLYRVKGRGKSLSHASASYFTRVFSIKFYINHLNVYQEISGKRKCKLSLYFDVYQINKEYHIVGVYNFNSLF